MDITNTISEAANYTHDHLGPWVVTVAIANRAYGGPEEGGWWYDTFDPTDEAAQELAREHKIGGIFWEYQEAKAYADAIDVICAGANFEERRPSKQSMTSRGVYEACIFEGWPGFLPSRRPTYE